MKNPSNNLKLAERGAILSIATYLILSAVKIIAGSTLQSSSLTADGFNNVSDIVANIAVLIGLRMARKPADRDHRFGHWKIEDLASLITSFIMFFVGFDVLIETIQKIISNQETKIDPVGAVVGIFSAIIMLGVYFYNKTLAKKAHSKALDAAAKDNLSDAVTSIGTSVAIIASAFQSLISWQPLSLPSSFSRRPMISLWNLLSACPTDLMRACSKTISKLSWKFLKSLRLSPSGVGPMAVISIWILSWK